MASAEAPALVQCRHVTEPQLAALDLRASSSYTAAGLQGPTAPLRIGSLDDAGAELDFRHVHVRAAQRAEPIRRVQGQAVLRGSAHGDHIR